MYTFHNICRTCSCQGDLRSLFEADPLILANMLTEIVDIKVVKGDKYPQNICSFCVDKLKNAYLFKKQCQAIQIKLELYLQSIAEASYNVVYKEEVFNNTAESTTENIEPTPVVPEGDDSKPPIEPVSILKVEDGNNSSNWNDDWADDMDRDDDVDHVDNPPAVDITPAIEPDINIITPPEKKKKEPKPKNWNRKERRQKGLVRKKVECGQCHKKVVDLEVHMKIHLNIPYKCEICGAEMLRKNYARHLRSHKDVRPVQCNKCGRNFRDNYTLRLHMRTHSGERPFECTECDKTFKLRFQLTNHLEKHRRGEIKIPIKVEASEREQPKEIADIGCDKCDEKFTTKLGLQRHLNLTHGIGKKTCVCDLCGKMLASKISLKHHQEHCSVKKENEDKSDEPKDWICEECNKKCNSREALNLHKTSHREKTHLCIQCGKLFSSKLTLKGHQLIHSGGKPYKCTICDQSFRHKQHLSNHRRTHTGEKPFKCMECDKSYTEKKSLTVHMRIHTGEMPYSCSYCNKGFYDLSNFKRHVASHKANEGKEPRKSHQNIHNFNLQNLQNAFNSSSHPLGFGHL